MSDIISGRTEVVVKRRKEENGREKIETIHQGIVIQQTTGGFVRVYNSKTDTSPEAAEWLPIASKMCWCEITRQRDEDDAFPIPATLR